MKPVQFIDEFKALLAKYIGDCYFERMEWGQRNAICVTICRKSSETGSPSFTTETAISAVTRAFGTAIPVLPDHNSRANLDDQIRRLLGQEFPAIVVDGSLGWPDNALGAAAGTVLTPGLLILLLPGGVNVSEKPTAYEQHLKRTLASHFQFHYSPLELWSISPLTETLSKSTTQLSENWQSEQRQVLIDIVDRCLSTSKTVDVLLARRGRGKSALIGQAIQRLTGEPHSRSMPTLTATHPSQVITAQKHTEDLSIKFTALDKALQQSGDILFVDEAGSVPVPVLFELTQHYKHTVFVGTVDGYEGSGRALAVRLRQILYAANPPTEDVQFHQLSHPIRWSKDDLVEKMVNDVLRLDSTEESITSPSILSSEELINPDHKQVFSDQLLADSNLLDSVFGLLLQAHYQTSSKDLQHLLDLNGLSLFVQTIDNVLSGACLVAHEGALSDETIYGVNQGNRRPAHQKLPMLLHRQTSDDELLRQHHWRVVRIAIQPEFQRQGLGTQLLTYVKQAALNTSNDKAPTFIGASFGGSTLGLQFWQQAGYLPFHWGYRLNPRSGQRSVAVAMCLSDSLDTSQTLIKTQTHFIDNIRTIRQLNALKPEWFTVLYGTRSLDDDFLEKMMIGDPRSANATPTNNLERMNQWREGKLALHDVWGSLAYSTGGAAELAAWVFPKATTAKQLMKLIKTRQFQT